MRVRNSRTAGIVVAEQGGISGGHHNKLERRHGGLGIAIIMAEAEGISRA